VISVDIAGHRFQLRAAAVVAHDGFILLHRLKGDEYWSLPGGRVKPGEDAQSTLEREMVEELNERVESAELLYVVENFFEHAGKELIMRSVCTFALSSVWHPGSSTSHAHAGVEGGKQLEFCWFLAEQLHEVDLRPSFLRGSLSRPILAFQHIVQRG
jgi:ADP-ribose pyrophosphatase YjhB (NUDIX family)